MLELFVICCFTLQLIATFLLDFTQSNIWPNKMNIKILRGVTSLVLVISMLFMQSIFFATPAFAQLGEVATPPPIVETPPAPVPTPEPTPPPVEPTPTPTVNTEVVTQIVTVPSDNIGPVISGLANLSLATHDATIVWTTDELAVSTLGL